MLIYCLDQYAIAAPYQKSLTYYFKLFLSPYNQKDSTSLK